MLQLIILISRCRIEGFKLHKNGFYIAFLVRLDYIAIINKEKPNEWW